MEYRTLFGSIVVAVGALCGVTDAGIIGFGDGGRDRTGGDAEGPWGEAGTTTVDGLTVTITATSPNAAIGVSGNKDELGVVTTGESAGDYKTNTGESFTISFDNPVFFQKFDTAASNGNLKWTSTAFVTDSAVTLSGGATHDNTAGTITWSGNKKPTVTVGDGVGASTDFLVAVGVPITIEGVAGGNSLDYITVETASTPEPSSALLAGLGMLVLGLIRRRRSR